MMLDGTDADGEWSDEEVVRSGSNTGVSETEAEELPISLPNVSTSRPQSSLGLMTSRPTYSFLTSEPISHNDDPVTSILDRIDAEIEMIGHTPSLPSPPNKNGKHRNGSKTSYRNGVSQSLLAPDNVEDTDTGLGSVSIGRDEGSNTDKINGVAEVYSEACMTDGPTDDDGIRHISDAPSDLDSVAAQQIDTKFKEIMRKKKDDPEEEAEASRHRPRSRKAQQGRTKVHFLTPPPQFRDPNPLLPPDLPIHPGKPMASLTLTPRIRHNRTRASATMLSTGYGTDNESIRTEDFETKFNNLLVTSDTEKQPEISPTLPLLPPPVAPKPGILSKNTRKKDISEDFPKPSSSRQLYASDSALNIAKPEEDDIINRLRNIANGKSPTTTNHAQSSSHALQGSNTARPRSLSPSRLSLRKHHTSGDLHRLWQSSGSNSSLKTDGNDSFWSNNRSNYSNINHNSSRLSPSAQSSSSTFDEVESLNFSSRSSNDSNQVSYDRGSFGNRKGFQGGGGGRKLFQGEGGFPVSGISEGGLHGIGDLHKRYISRQSSTTSTSTSPSSGNFASSEASQSSSKDMVLAKILLDFLETFGDQANIGPADKLHLRKLTKQIADWDSRTNGGNQRDDMPDRVTSKSNTDPYPAWSESGSIPSSSGRNRDDRGGAGEKAKPHLMSDRLSSVVNTQKKRRKDLIIPDDEDSSPPGKDYKRNQEKESRRLKGQDSCASIKTNRRNENKEHGIYSYHNAESLQDKKYGEGKPPSRREASFNKSASLDSNATPPDGYNPFLRPFSTSHAERVLMGLGFGGKEGFLPERFLRDWYSKLSGSQEKEYIRSSESDAKTTKEKEKHSNKDKNNSTTLSVKESGEKGNESGRVHVRHMRQDSVTSSQLDEAATLPSRINSNDGKTRQINEYLSALSTNDISAREMRMKSFANSRQKSLPLYLETLSEEDEKNARVPGIDPFDKEAKLQMFITDVMSSSGKSTESNSGQSIPSSVVSEYDTMSSSSDGLNLSVSSRSDVYRGGFEKREEYKKKPLKAIKESADLSQGYLKDNVQSSKIQTQTASPKSNKGNTQDRKIAYTNNSKATTSDREVHFSTDSLEVADIMKVDHEKLNSNAETPNSEGNAKVKRNPMLKNVEPAMVSIVLEDVDEGKYDNNSRTQLSRTESGRLSVPSNSLSLSPIPQSPVTVIEVGLDNTHDSLDTEDGLNSSREIDNYSPLNTRQVGTTVSCSNCGNSVTMKYKRSGTETECKKDLNEDDETFSNKSHRSDEMKSQREKSSHKNNLDVSKGRTKAKWVNSSDESSFEGARRHRESKLARNRSPNLSSRRRSPYSHHLSPCHSPSYNRHPKDIDTDSCSRHGHHSTSSQCTSLSPSPVSSMSEKNKRMRWMDQAQNIYNDYRCHNKCVYHSQADKHYCDYHYSVQQHHYHPHPCQQHSELCRFHTSHCRHHHRSPQHLSKYEPSFQLTNYNTPISAHSSPGSIKSAFRSPLKEKELFSNIPNQSVEKSEKSETDQDEFPSSILVIGDPRPISVNPSDMLHHSCLSNGENLIPSISDTFDDHQSPLVFSEESSPRSNVSTTQKGKVYQISRAVQANLPNVDTRLMHRSTCTREDYFLAFDTGTQCSLGEKRKGSKTCFSKFVQTRVPSCEVSCQTADQSSLLDKNYSTRSKLSKGMNTVISLIGDEHDIGQHGTYIPDNLRSKRHEFQLVDDTLDLIEMELVAIEDKAKIKQKVNGHRDTISSHRKTDLVLSTLLNPNPPQVSVNQVGDNNPWQNSFVSNSFTQTLPSQQSTQNVYTNPHINENVESDKENVFNVDYSKSEIEECRHNIFDVEKEMSAYLKPCQGMYDGVSTPELFRSSPAEMSPSPLFQPIDSEITNENDPGDNEILSTHQQSPSKIVAVSSNGELTKAGLPEIASVAENGNEMFKGRHMPIISVNDFHKDLLQIPSLPHNMLLKAQYPSLSRDSSPKSTKSASPIITARSTNTNSMLEPPRSHSLHNIPASIQSEDIIEPKYDEPKVKTPIIHLISEAELRSIIMIKSQSVELNSDNSEMPHSSSRDSLTEVSIMSSVEGQPNKQSLRVSTSLDSNKAEGVNLESLHLPEGVEFSLSCPHSNWAGMYSHKTLRPSRMERLLRSQTSGSDRFTSLYSMDALSDRSLAGSEIAQDIDEMEVIISQRSTQRSDSGSTYSDVDDDNFVDEWSEASTSNMREDDIEEGPKTYLVVSDDHYDLLQISDCGELSPSQSRMSLTAEDLDCLHISDDNTDFGIKSSIDKGHEKIPDSSETRDILIDRMPIRQIKKQQKIDQDLTENIEIKTKGDDQASKQDIVVVDPLCIDAPSVSNNGELNLGELSSPDYNIIPSQIYGGHAFATPTCDLTKLRREQAEHDHTDGCLLSSANDGHNTTDSWWSKVESPQWAEEHGVKEVDGNINENLLKTFQSAEFDSLLNQPIPAGVNPLALYPKLQNSNSMVESEKASDFEAMPNAHILSVETEDASKTMGNRLDSFMEECNIMDELEIIALFKNMEHFNDVDQSELTPKICSPFALSEIPEEDTQSEESLSISHRMSKESGRTFMAQETQESVIEVKYLEPEDNADSVVSNDSGNSNKDDTNIVNSCSSNSDHENELGIDTKCSKQDIRPDPITKNIIHNDSPKADVSRSPPTRSDNQTVTRETTSKEERTYSSGLLYYCNSKSETTQKTTLNFTSPKLLNQMINDSTDPNDGGHLSTISLTVGDYRKVESDNTDNNVQQVISDQPDANTESKVRKPMRQLVKTMYSQSLSDDSASVFISTRNNVPDQEKSSSKSGKFSAHGKSLRSRESLLKLHDQKKYTGSDSDSETPHQNAPEDYKSKRENSDFDDTSAAPTVADRASENMFEGFLTYEGKSYHTHSEMSSTRSPMPETTSPKRQQNNPHVSLSITRGVIYPDKKSSEVKETKVNPRVIVQQASDDIPFWDYMSWRNSASTSPPTISETNDNHLHPQDIFDGDKKRGDLNDSRNESSFNTTAKTGLWTRRANRSNLLSPNMALLNNSYKESAPPLRREYTSSNDDSHPELDYLDLIPKFSGVKETPVVDNRLRLPVQKIGMDTNSNRNQTHLEPLVLFRSPTTNINTENTQQRKIEIKANEHKGAAYLEPQSTSGESLPAEFPHAETSSNTKGNEQNTKDVEKKTYFTKPPEIQIPSPENEIMLSSEEIDRFVNSEACDDIVNRLITEPPSTSDSVESSDSKFVSAVSRDSGFDSRGSPIDQTHPKGPQRKNVLFLSGVEFSDEKV